MDIGDKVLGYVIDRKLGEGGMGQVFHAVHPVLRQEVAIKVLDPMLARNANVRERFIQEAIIQTQLLHPGIVQVLTADVDSSELSLVMEYIDGLSLDQVIALRGPLPVDDAKRIMLQVLDGVAVAHSRGVIHRDLKPSNIMVRADGSVKVMDFGIAKVLGSAKITRAGTVMGSAHYMSPEQITGLDIVDCRSDIYSLGCTFFEIFVGHPPFADKELVDTDSDYQIKEAHVRASVPNLRVIRPDLPVNISNAVMAALSKEPNNRPGSCLEMANLLKATPVVKPTVKTKLIVSSPDQVTELCRQWHQEGRSRFEIVRSLMKDYGLAVGAAGQAAETAERPEPNRKA